MKLAYGLTVKAIKNELSIISWSTFPIRRLFADEDTSLRVSNITTNVRKIEKKFPPNQKKKKKAYDNGWSDWWEI